MTEARQKAEERLAKELGAEYEAETGGVYFTSGTSILVREILWKALVARELELEKLRANVVVAQASVGGAHKFLLEFLGNAGSEPACTKKEWCILPKGHEGECVEQPPVPSALPEAPKKRED